MKDITIIVPIHQYNDEVAERLKISLGSVVTNRKTYTNGKLIVRVICPPDIVTPLKDVVSSVLENEDFLIIVNEGETDFCSQINECVKTINTEHFSILEFDDMYTDKWFKMANDYYFTNETVSLFIPINILSDGSMHFQYANEIAWSSVFSKKIGYLDYETLEEYSSFNLTGGIFNTNDFIEIGGLKPSIKASFFYEFMLRLTKKELKIFVVPKEGYLHTIMREGSLSDIYSKTLTNKEIDKWFELSKIECNFKEDRGTTISSDEILK